MDDRSGSVLVLTNPLDVTADAVLRVLAERRVPVVRLDPGTDLHTDASLTATYRTGDQRGTLHTASRDLDLSAVRSVWVRRASPYEGPSELGGQDRRFAASQALWGAGGILASLPAAHYVNHPWAASTRRRSTAGRAVGWPNSPRPQPSAWVWGLGKSSGTCPPGRRHGRHPAPAAGGP